MVEEVRVLIYGGRYVRRLADNLADLEIRSDSVKAKGYGSKMGIVGKGLALSTKFDLRVRALGYSSEAASRIEALQASLHHLQRLQPSQVILQAGEADLQDPELTAEQVANKILELARAILAIDSVKQVCIGQMIMRRTPPQSVPTYNEKVVETNRAISAAVPKDANKALPGSFSKKDSTELIYITHRGFWNSQNDLYTQDGFQLNREFGLPKLYRSMKNAVLLLLRLNNLLENYQLEKNSEESQEV